MEIKAAMPVTGFEIALSTAAERAAKPIIGRQMYKKRISSAAPEVRMSWPPEIPELTAEEANSLIRYLTSGDLEVVARQIALTQLQKITKTPLSTSPFALTDQIREGLRGATGLQGGRLRQVVTVLESHLTNEVTSLVNAKSLESLPSEVLARVIESIGDQSAASFRNLELLQHITDLAVIHEFENHLAGQIRKMKSKMKLENSSNFKSAPYSRLYVQPTLVLKNDLSQRRQEEVDIDDIIAAQRIVILGDPGGGKSTLAGKVVYDLANEANLSYRRIPFFMPLRDYASSFQAKRLPLVSHLSDLCRDPYQLEPPADAVEYLLLNGRAAVIFDGLDELIDTTLRAHVVEAIEGFAHRYPNTSIIVTSRRVGYNEAPLDSELFLLAKLEEFSEGQIRKYVTNWFEYYEDLEGSSVPLVEPFMRESELVQDLRTNPLMLSLMCSLYSWEGYIPQKRLDVYEKCSVLLFQTWDKKRDIKIPLPFDAHVESAVQSLAWWLYTEPGSKGGLPRVKLLSFMTDFLSRERFPSREDAENAAVSFIDYCTGRAWVLTNIDTDQDGELYGFTHRTFLEYFAAVYMARKYHNAETLFTELRGHLESAEWEVVAQLALQSLNRHVAGGANDFLRHLLASAASSELRAKSNLLSFAARSLAFVVPSPTVLSELVHAISSFSLEMPGLDSDYQDRHVVPPEELFLYDSPLSQLGSNCGREVSQGVIGSLYSFIMDAFASGSPRENILLFCEEPEFVAEKALWLKDSRWTEIQSTYLSHVKHHPFIWRDIKRYRKKKLSLVLLLERYGPRVFYYCPIAQTGSQSWIWLVDIYAMFVEEREKRQERVVRAWQTSSGGHPRNTKGRLRNFELAFEIVNFLPLADTPWCSYRDIVTRPLQSTFAAAAPTVIGANILLDLAIVESIPYHRPDMPSSLFGDPRQNGELGRLLSMCDDARHERIELTEVEAALRDARVPTSVVDFVLKWVKKQINLLSV